MKYLQALQKKFILTTEFGDDKKWRRWNSVNKKSEYTTYMTNEILIRRHVAMDIPSRFFFLGGDGISVSIPSPWRRKIRRPGGRRKFRLHSVATPFKWNQIPLVSFYTHSKSEERERATHRARPPPLAQPATGHLPRRAQPLTVLADPSRRRRSAPAAASAPTRRFFGVKCGIFLN